MISINEQIQNADYSICQNIDNLSEQRDLLSQNVLSQLRNLVEGVAVLLHKQTGEKEFSYFDVNPALDFVKSRGNINFLSKFHNLIQKIASHYTLDGDTSERLMLKYYEYLFRVRRLMKDSFGISILNNLEKFPIDLDPSLREYHEKIAVKIDTIRSSELSGSKDRYYIHKTRPFFINGRIFYEVTFYRAINKVNKFDRIIAFTDIEMIDKYAAQLTIFTDTIEVINKEMPIMVIQNWETSIRPCEFDNFARLFGIRINTRTNSHEYQYLMKELTSGKGSLIDLIDIPDDHYNFVKAKGTSGTKSSQLFPVIDEARQIIRSGAPGYIIIRYLMLRMNNKILKLQYNHEGCNLLSNLKLHFGCIPFDQMPFCTSLRGHNPRYWDLVESLDFVGRKHELLARFVKNNVEQNGMLYTPLGDIQEQDDIDNLISCYNDKIYYKHTGRKLISDKGHVFITQYEDDTVSLITKLQEYASSGISGYSQAVERWISESARNIDDPLKVEALKNLFSNSRVALIYGAAGTGKSTMVDHIAHYFNDKEKLFLAHTNPAIDNLKRKVTAQNSEFRTISSQIRRNQPEKDFDLLVIDECSTVSNSDLIEVLEKTDFTLLVLVGDIYQIESIQFGNWFGIINSFIPDSSVFELNTPFRTSNEALIKFWKKVRHIEDDIAEVIAHNGYSTVLDKTLFENRGRDEIILCLNYDGLYGINNVNRFLQSSNPNEAVTWRVSTYKVGDPILFFETERFRPVIYNNLKGIIVNIEQERGRIQFDIELDRPLSEFDVWGVDDLEWLEGTIVRFSVFDNDISDDDIDSLNSTVPFQVAYAVSIHKAQGLEFDSVKIVITDANEEDITHNIFYTAVTRARKQLKIFWTPETQQAVIKRLVRSSNSKDVALLSNRRGMVQVRRR